MYCSYVFLLFLSFQVFPYSVDALTCIATTGGTCTGATYCTSVWNKQTNGTWTPLVQGCMITSMVQNNLNKWQMPTPTTATYVCSANNCNGPPTGNMPTSPPAPAYVQCIGTFGNCTAHSCAISTLNNLIAQSCNYNGKMGEIILGPRIPRFSL